MIPLFRVVGKLIDGHLVGVWSYAYIPKFHNEICG